MGWSLRKNERGWGVWDGEELVEERPLAFLTKASGVFGSREELEEWLLGEEKKKAKNWALRWLALRDLPSHRLEEKLGEKGVSAPLSREVVEWLRGLGYVSDDRVLRREVERAAEKGYGPRAVVWKLRAKGFAAEEIEREVGEVMTRERQRAEIAKWAKKKGWDRKRAMGEFLRRGFSADLIREAF